jgi:hypothetical protein
MNLSSTRALSTCSTNAVFLSWLKEDVAFRESHGIPKQALLAYDHSNTLVRYAMGTGMVTGTP